MQAERCCWLCSCGRAGDRGARRRARAPLAVNRERRREEETDSASHEDRPQPAQEMGTRGQDHTHPAGARECDCRRQICWSGSAGQLEQTGPWPRCRGGGCFESLMRVTRIGLFTFFFSYCRQSSINCCKMIKMSLRLRCLMYLLKLKIYPWCLRRVEAWFLFLKSLNVEYF